MNIEIIILSMVEEYKWSNGYKVKEGEKVFSIESTNFFFTSKTTYPKNYQRLLNSYAFRKVPGLVNFAVPQHR